MLKRRPTKRALVIVLVSALLVLAGSTAQAGWLFVLAAGVLGVLGASLVYPQRVSSLEVVRSVPVRARVGDDARVGLRVRNVGKRPLPLLMLEDRFPAFAPLKVAVEPLAARAEAELETVCKAFRRGVFAGGEVVLHCGAPFGLVRSRRTVGVPARTVVVPRWVELSSFPLLEPASFPSEELHERARTGAGQEFLGVREYRPGDPRRLVHWRSSARTGQLVVREYQEEAMTRVAVVLAGNDAGEPPDSAFEAIVSAAASVALYSVVTGHPVDLYRPGRGGIERLGDPERNEALEWLAETKPMDAPLRPLVDAALRRSGRRGTVVIVAPACGAAGSDLADAIRLVQAAGARAIAIVTLCSTWDEGSRDLALPSLGDGRTPLRYLRKGEDLLACLQG